MIRHLFVPILSLLALAWTTTESRVRADETNRHDHDRFVTRPTEAVRDFEAFTLSFDTDADGVALGVPDWVAYELRRDPSPGGKSASRPSRWSTDADLHRRKLAPDDSSYRNSGYSRGHMCMKSHAGRIGPSADRETHTVLNACPQMQAMNGGIWLAIENLTGRWADEHGAIWIVTGPVFTNDRTTWIGDPGEIPVAVPDAFFKLVVRDDDAGIQVLAFLVPMHGDRDHSSSKADVRPYLTSVDIIEALTGLDFLSSLPDPEESLLERRVDTRLWTSPDTERLGTASRAARDDPATLTSPPASPDAPLALRPGRTPSPIDRATATALVTRGWRYVMPRPKSSRAAWGNTDARTTWWPGHWMNSRLDRASTTQPTRDDGFRGDGVEPGWTRGGSPAKPTDVQWLCSESGGPAPNR
ncbi:MAG: DNA/RNA non-specific endonuclease [Phycisphaera sp.]|nr:DNA/RNA non-specific endonuclease [Phycisphaera sp.]